MILHERTSIFQIVIFGATGQTGQQLIMQALERQHKVVAVARNPNTLTIKHPGLNIVHGDFSVQSSIENAVRGQEIVLSAIGAPMSRAPTSIHADSARSILNAMQKTGIKRFLCVSSGGANPNHDPNLPLLFEQGFKRIFANIYRDQMEMEKIVMASNTDWTIVRPAGLNNQPASGHCRVAEGYALKGGNQTPRADLAAFMLDQMDRPDFIHKGVAIAI